MKTGILSVRQQWSRQDTELRFGPPKTRKGLRSIELDPGTVGLLGQHRQAQELQRTSAQAAAFLKDVSVAAAVHLHGIAADIARDRLHENTVLARDVMESLAEAFHACELQVEQGLFYLQR